MSKDPFTFEFKNEIPLGKPPWPVTQCSIERRTQEAKKIMDKFKERIPVVIERAASEQKLPDLE